MPNYNQDFEKSINGFKSQANDISIHELDENGLLYRTHELDTSPTPDLPNQERSTSILSYTQNDMLKLFAEVFLPSGYPYSVRPDYINYQIYDSLQAFSSSIASLFANRAVLSAVGVGDETASSTSALLMKIVQETVGRLGTILFAWKFGSTLEPECKKYRFMADILNDGATIFDCLSPFFPFNKALTISMLCMSGLLRAVCGVTGTGSRAALTLHFTDPDKGSVADVNAKDQSQETVISLLGMLAGSVAVAVVTGEGIAMWAVLLSLLGVHLYTNYRAVKSVVMITLNRQRANIVFADAVRSLESFKPESLVAHSKILLSPKKVAEVEAILQAGNLIKNSKGEIIGTAEFVDYSVIKYYSSQLRISVTDLLSTKSNGYVLCYEIGSNKQPKVGITLVEDTENVCKHMELRAWIHAYLVCLWIFRKSGQSPLEIIQETENMVEYLFDELDICTGLKSSGWDLNCGMILTYPVKRIRVVENVKM